MMAKRPSLGSAQIGRVAPGPVEPSPEANAKRSQSRQGKRGVAFWLDPLPFKELRSIGLDEDRSLQSLMEEAVDLLFETRGKHRMARKDAA